MIPYINNTERLLGLTQEDTMCIRTVFWEESGKELPARSTQQPVETSAVEHAKQDLPQDKPGRLPQLLEASLDFIKGAAGIRA